MGKIFSALNKKGKRGDYEKEIMETVFHDDDARGRRCGDIHCM